MPTPPPRPTRRISVAVVPGAAPGKHVQGMGGARIRVGDAVWLRDKVHKEKVFARGTLRSAAVGDGCTVEMGDGELVQ